MIGDRAGGKGGGCVRPVGQAPKDFSAQAVVDLRAVAAVMGVNWDPASSEAFGDVSMTRIELNMSGVGPFHHVARRGVVVDLTTLSQAAALIARDDDSGLFLLQHDGVTQLFTRFSQFASELDALLVSGYSVQWVHARGRYADAAAELTARFARVRLQ